jgi:hypothetical protein
MVADSNTPHTTCHTPQPINQIIKQTSFILIALAQRYFFTPKQTER